MKETPKQARARKRWFAGINGRVVKDADGRKIGRVVEGFFYDERERLFTGRTYDGKTFYVRATDCTSAERKFAENPETKDVRYVDEFEEYP